MDTINDDDIFASAPALRQGYASPEGTAKLVLNSYLESGWELSGPAVQVANYLASKPAGWIVRVAHLVKVSGKPERYIRAAVADLRRHGYLRDVQERGPDGRLGRHLTYLETTRVRHLCRREKPQVSTASTESGGAVEAPLANTQAPLAPQVATASTESGGAVSAPAPEPGPENDHENAFPQVVTASTVYRSPVKRSPSSKGEELSSRGSETSEEVSQDAATAPLASSGRGAGDHFLNEAVPRSAFDADLEGSILAQPSQCPAQKPPAGHGAAPAASDGPAALPDKDIPRGPCQSGICGGAPDSPLRVLPGQSGASYVCDPCAARMPGTRMASRAEYGLARPPARV